MTSPTVTLTIPAKTEYLVVARLALAGIARAVPADESALADLKLAVTEACGNAVRHARQAHRSVVRIGFALDGDSTAVRTRASWSTLDRGLAGSIVQPSVTGREANSRTSGGIDLRVERHGITWNGAADLTREHVTFADPTPPFGIAYDDAVTARGFTANGNAAAGIGPVSAIVGGELDS